MNPEDEALAFGGMTPSRHTFAPTGRLAIDPARLPQILGAFAQSFTEPARGVLEQGPRMLSASGYDPGADAFNLGMAPITATMPLAPKGAIGSGGGKLYTPSIWNDLSFAFKGKAPNEDITKWMQSELNYGVKPEQFKKDWVGQHGVTPEIADWMLKYHHDYAAPAEELLQHSPEVLKSSIAPYVGHGPSVPDPHATGTLGEWYQSWKAGQTPHGPSVPQIGAWPTRQLGLPLPQGGAEFGQTGGLSTSLQSRLKRAKELEFDVDPADRLANVWLHGTHQPHFSRFDPRTFGEGSGSSNEPAFWFTKLPQVSSEYSGTAPHTWYNHDKIRAGALLGNLSQPRTIPVYVRPHSQFEVSARTHPDLDIGNDKIMYDSGYFRDILREAKAAGHRSVLFKDVRDMGPTSDQLAMFNPHDIRSVNALFDPAKRYDPNLLSGFAGAALGVPTLLSLLRRQQQPEDNER